MCSNLNVKLLNERVYDNQEYLYKQENGNNHYVFSKAETALSSISEQIPQFLVLLPSCVSHVYGLRPFLILRSFHHGFCNLQEGRFYVARIFGGRLAERGVERVCIFLSNGCSHLLLLG